MTNPCEKLEEDYHKARKLRRDLSTKARGNPAIEEIPLDRDVFPTFISPEQEASVEEEEKAEIEEEKALEKLRDCYTKHGFPKQKR